MAAEFTDAEVSSVLLSVKDKQGRSVSIGFLDDRLIVHRRRPRKGKKVEISYDELCDLVLRKNRDFFD